MSCISRFLHLVKIDMSEAEAKSGKQSLPTIDSRYNRNSAGSLKRVVSDKKPRLRKTPCGKVNVVPVLNLHRLIRRLFTIYSARNDNRRTRPRDGGSDKIKGITG